MMTLMMTSAQVVETSVNVTSNSPSQDYTHPDDHNLPNYDMTPGFKPFTVINSFVRSFLHSLNIYRATHTIVYLIRYLSTFFIKG